jgi:hypothetical protein
VTDEIGNPRDQTEEDPQRSRMAPF